LVSHETHAALSLPTFIYRDSHYRPDLDRC